MIRNIQSLDFPWVTLDPFLFCAHHNDKYPAANSTLGPATSLAGRQIGQDFSGQDGWSMYHGSEVPGFPAHPHRGFETVTIVKAGFIDHADSLGAAGRFGAGDVQWMTAGKGVQHSEMFPLLSENHENPLELFQVWLNLPAKDKMVNPHFAMLWQDNIPTIQHTDDKNRTVNVDVIAGVLNKSSAPTPPPNSWAANSEHCVSMLTLTMDADTIWTLPPSHPDSNRMLYFYRGNNVTIDGQSVAAESAIELQPDIAVTLQNGSEPAYFLVLQGKPIGEPVANHGPFVMNSREELAEAFSEYQQTQFGGWPWPSTEQVHAADKQRFALHADGKEESRKL